LRRKDDESGEEKGDEGERADGWEELLLEEFLLPDCDEETAGDEGSGEGNTCRES
jgi:hypothetical protein